MRVVEAKSLCDSGVELRLTVDSSADSMSSTFVRSVVTLRVIWL